MECIVVQVLEYKIDSMNGQKFKRYTMKLKADNSTFITDGFSNDLNINATLKRK